ncbi:MAG: Gfo/Idh/MocA family oxidoreductase [Planctomycetaceae bacterium]|jgi:predicted dehydrogenase|nr:Gfo/Idh/MocA family oxidoreductase [Planctomycetaceae bacterium]
MLRIGIHGLGFMGMMHYLAYQKLSGVKVTAICETLPERRKGDWTKIKGNFGPQGTQMDLTGVAVYAEAEEFLADKNIDVADICLPPNQHCPMTVAALRAGKHVFSEKPVALSLADADAMVAAAEKSGKILMVGHVLPFFPAYAFVYEAARTNRYGKLLGGHFDRVISDPVWLKDFYNMATIGGPLLDLHIHDAHFIRLLFGMPEKVQSVGRLRNGVPEYFNTQFIFDNPQLVVTSTSGCIFQQGRPFMARSEVHFEKATVVIDGGGTTVLTEDGQAVPAELPALDEVGIFANELKESTDAFIQNKVSPILGGSLARDALALAMMEMEALRKPERI